MNIKKKYLISGIILLIIIAGTTAYFTPGSFGNKCINSKGEWSSLFKECTWNKESDRIFQLAFQDKEYCINQGWKWTEGTCGNKMRCPDYCSPGESVAKRKCLEIGGQFNESSPCRNTGNGMPICIDCCEVCTLK